MRKITQRQIELFERHLTVEEKSGATREKYVRDVKLFVAWLGARAVDKECVVQLIRSASCNTRNTCATDIRSPV